MCFSTELFQNVALIIKTSTPIEMASCRYHPEACLIEDSHAGDIICPECGLVCVDRCLDVSVEWNYTKTSRPVENSKIVHPEGDKPDDMPPNVPSDESRNQKRIFNQTLKMAARNIKEMAEKINLTKAVVDKAIQHFNTIHDKEYLKGMTKDSIGSACLYLICRQESMPRKFREVCAVSKARQKEIGKVFELILENREFLPHEI